MTVSRLMLSLSFMPPSASSSSLLAFHRSPHSQYGHPERTRESVGCIRNLASHQVAWTGVRKGPRSRRAAVLVALFVGRKGDLYVLLSQRAKVLRTYAGDTSLPGGKYEDADETIEATARREAFEEIGLSMDKTKVPLLCILEPFLAGNQLIVTPVVVLVLDQSIRPVLNRGEVESLFSHPLKAFLTSDSSILHEPLSEEVPYHTYADAPWTLDRERSIRMHRFLTGREAGGIKPIFGLTASILIRVATIGYGHAPDFEVKAPGQPSMQERINRALRHETAFIEAYEQEEEGRRKGSGLVREFMKRAIRREKIQSRL